MNRGVDLAAANHRGLVGDQVARVIGVAGRERRVFNQRGQPRTVAVLIEPPQPGIADVDGALRCATRNEALPE